MKMKRGREEEMNRRTEKHVKLKGGIDVDVDM